MNSKATLYQRFWLVLLAATVAATYISQLNYDAWRRYGTPKINDSYNVYIEPQPLSPATAKAVSFGQNEFVADYYWLQFIQYYGGGDPYGKYRKLAEMFNLVTDLSPENLPAYQTSLLILPGEGFVNEALALGEKGKKNLPQSWEVPYYTGLVYHMYKKDFTAAAKEFDLAASLPNAPANAKLFAGIYFNKANDRQTAYLIFKTIYDSSKDDFVKERAAKYVGHLEIIFFLEDGVKTFHDRFGRYPKSTEELVSKGVIKEIPASPLNLTFVVNPTTGAISDQK